MLKQKTIDFFTSIVLQEYVKQDEIINYETYLKKFEKYIEEKYYNIEKQQIMSAIVLFKLSKFRIFQDIKNFNLNPAALSSLEEYVSNLKKEQRIEFLNQYLHKLTQVATTSTDEHFKLLSYKYINKIILISLDCNCFEEISKEKDNLKSFIKENFKEFFDTCKISSYEEIPLKVYLFKLEYFIGVSNTSQISKSYIKKNEDKIMDFFNSEVFKLLNEEEIKLLLKFFKPNLPVNSLIDINKSTMVFDKKILIHNFIEGYLEYKIDDILEIYNPQLIFAKEQYFKKDLNKLLNSNNQYYLPELIYKLDFLPLKEKKELMNKIDDTEIKKVFTLVEDFFKKEVIGKLNLKKIKMGF